MSLLTASSANSRARGYEYFKNKKVLLICETGEGCYHAAVSGSGKEPYDVKIDINHARKSSCTCPHAAGKRIICKHMIAAFFTAFPQEAEQYYEGVVRSQEEWEEYQEELYDRVYNFVHKLKKDDAHSMIMELLVSGPEWQWDQFVSTYIGSIEPDDWTY